MSLDQAKLEAFTGLVVGDMAAAASGMMTNLGHKLGLYKAMAGAGPLTAAQLSKSTNMRERYVLEWLNNQVAGRYLDYDPTGRTYAMSEEQAMVLADPSSPVFLAPGFDVVSSLWLDEDKVAGAFKTGTGIGWHEHNERLFSGTEALFRPGYRANLVGSWIPALTGVEAALKRGGSVADIGCGHGASTIVMAKAFPKSRFVGSDYHDGSIAVARQRAEEAGVADRVSFEVAPASGFSGDSYDLICFMDCFHDLGDPEGAARHARAALSAAGSVLLVEPFAGDHVEDNIGPVGRLFYAASTAICTPNSLSQDVGLGLGAQAGEEKLTAVLIDAGFTAVRRAAETPFNLIMEARH